MNRITKAFTIAGILVASILGATTAQAVPTISVTSTTNSGTYVVGDQINVTINFSETVWVTGNPTITLETGPTDRTIFCNNYNSETATSSLSCAYTVQVGDRSLDLDYQSSGAMLFNQSGQKIAASAGGAAISLTLPTPGSVGSLSDSKSFVINGNGEAEQWQSPAAAVAGLHSFVMQEDLRENVSQLRKSDDGRICSVAVMNAMLQNGTATLHTATTHGFQNNESITISGMANSTYNGTYVIGNASGNSFTYTRSGSPADSPSTAVRAGLASLDCSQSTVDYKSVLPACASQTEVDCIESVQAWSTSTPNDIKDGDFDQLYPKRGAQDFLSPAIGIKGGGPSSIFDFPDFPHRLSAGECINGQNCGSLYAVTVTLAGRRSVTEGLSSPSFFASITPTEIRNTTCDVRYNGDQSLVATGDGYCMDSSTGGVAVDRDGGYRCIMFDNEESNTDADRMITSGGSSTDISTCAMKHAFPNGVKFKINVRLSMTPAGWFHGRMSNPDIRLIEINGVTNISIAAGAVAVPVVGASGPYASFSQDIKDWFGQNCSSSQGSCGTRMGGQDWTNSLVRNAEVSPYPYSALSFSQLELWKNFFDESAGAVPSHWSVRTLSGSEMGSAGQCITNTTGVTGVVTTNATLYSQGPPAYSSSTGTLDYQVAAPHFLNDGVTEFLGEYNLLVREDVAQCLYNLSGLTNLSASDITSSLSVVDASNVTKSATPSFSRENGFFKFSATGFTFSAPTIKAKLQVVQSAATPAPSVATPQVTVPEVAVPEVTVPAVTVPAVTVPVVTVPVITPKIGAPVVIASPPAAKVAANIGMAVDGSVVRTAIKVPALVKGVGIQSYQVVLRSSSGRILAMQTITKPVAGKVMQSKLSAPLSGSYKVEIVATTTKGVKLPKWSSPPVKIKK